MSQSTENGALNLTDVPSSYTNTRAKSRNSLGMEDYYDESVYYENYGHPNTDSRVSDGLKSGMDLEGVGNEGEGEQADSLSPYDNHENSSGRYRREVSSPTETFMWLVEENTWELPETLASSMGPEFKLC